MMTRSAWLQVMWRVFDNVARHHLSVVAAGIAFFGVLSIFPALAALVGLYGLVANPADVMGRFTEFRPLLPPDAYSLIETQLQALLDLPPQKIGLAFILAIFLALWTARAGVSALVEGLNIAYREIDTRNIFVGFLMSLLLTMVIIAFACVALFATVVLPAALRFVDIGPLGTALAAFAPIVILGVAVVFGLGGLYRYGPHRELARKRWITPGAIWATVAWVIASFLLSIYVSGFANFNKTYGSLGAIAALMFWFYVSAFVVLLGAELNAELELQTARDTTTGPEKPLGQRGAYVADNVA